MVLIAKNVSNFLKIISVSSETIINKKMELLSARTVRFNEARKKISFTIVSTY